MKLEEFLKDIEERIGIDEFVYPEELTRIIEIIRVQNGALDWYENWDWSDKYVQAVDKRAKQTRKIIEEIVRKMEE